MDESRRAELEAEIERLFGIEKQNNEEAKKYRHKIRYRLAYDEYEDKTYRDQVEKLQHSADEAGSKACEIQKQLESVDTPPEQLITDLGDDKPMSKPETDRPIYIGEIPNDVLRDAVEKMACGWKRIDVAKELMAQDPLPEWLRSISDMGVLSDKEKTDADNLLSQRLRVADQKSEKFSRTRFQKHYEAALDGARLALRDRIHNLIRVEVETLEKAALDFQRLYDDVQRKIDASSEDTEQWERNTKLLMRIQRERTTNVDKPLTRLFNVLNSLTSSDE